MFASERTATPEAAKKPRLPDEGILIYSNDDSSKHIQYLKLGGEGAVERRHTVRVIKRNRNRPRLRRILLHLRRATASRHASILNVAAPLHLQVPKHRVVAQLRVDGHG